MSVIGKQERARIAAEQRRRSDVEQRFKAARGESLRETIERAAKPRPPPAVPESVRRDRATAELTAFGRRLTPGDLQTIDALHSRGGWPAVAQALSQAGLSADAIQAAGAVAKQHGLPALGQSVSAEIQRQDVASIRAAAEPEAAALLARMSPADLNEAARILATGGPEALAAKAAELGLHPAVATVAIHTIAAHGPEGARQAAVQHVQAAHARAAEQEADKAIAEAWTPADGDSRRDRAVKEGSPIAAMVRDPAFRAAAGQMAQRLVAMGLEKPQGMSSAEFVIDMLERMDGGHAIDAERKPFDPRWTPEQKLAAATEILGGSDPAAVRRFLSTFKTAAEGHKLVDRLAAHDEHRPAGPKAPPKNELRAAVEAAAAKHGGVKERPLAVGNSLQATIALASGRKPRDLETFTTHAAEDVQRMADGINNPAPDTSVRGAIEAAIAAEEDDETGGGTDE